MYGCMYVYMLDSFNLFLAVFYILETTFFKKLKIQFYTHTYLAIQVYVKAILIEFKQKNLI